MDQHTKHFMDNQLQSLELPCYDTNNELPCYDTNVMKYQGQDSLA